MRLILVRHGQTAWNVERRAQGHADTELDPTGLEQASRLATLAEHLHPELLLSSDLRRCVQTLEPFAEALEKPIQTTPVLRERSFGEWEGMNYLEIRRRIREVDPDFPERVRPPGGESVQDVWDRLEAVAEELRGGSETVLVATHGGSKALLLARLLKGSILTARSFRFPNCSVTELEGHDDGQFTLRAFARVEHLHHDPKRSAFGLVG